MPRKESKAVPEDNGPISQDAGKMVICEELRQSVSETWGEAFRDLKGDLRRMGQRLADLEQDAWLRLAMEVDGPVDSKTRECTEGAAIGVQAMRGDSFSSNRVDTDPNTSASFDDDVTGPPAPRCSTDDALIDNGAAAPKSCLSPLEMCSPITAGGLLHTAKTTTVTWTTFDQQTLWFCMTEETNLRTSILYAWYYGSFYPRAAAPARGSLKRIRGKTGCLILAVLQVISTPARC